MSAAMKRREFITLLGGAADEAPRFHHAVLLMENRP
jgi:hypothetical protein